MATYRTVTLDATVHGNTATGNGDVSQNAFTALAQLIPSAIAPDMLSYEVGEYTPNVNIPRIIIPFQKAHDTPPAFFMLIAKASPEIYDANTIVGFLGVSFEYLFDQSLQYGGVTNYGYLDGLISQQAGSSPSTAMFLLSRSAYTDTSTMSYANYATKDVLKPYFSGSMYFRKTMTYKWVAVWAKQG